MTIWAADKANIPVSICGEMAGDAHLTRLLLGMGLARVFNAPGPAPECQTGNSFKQPEMLKPKVDKVLSLVEEAAIEEAVQQLQLEKTADQS